MPGRIVEVTTPLIPAVAQALAAGQQVRLSGPVYAARDAAHQRLAGLLAAGRPLPVPLAGQVVYYVGPTPAPPGRAVGAAGPTTSSRMDPYTPALLEAGLAGMIGKGARSAAVVSAMVRCRAVYFAAMGGLGALLARHIVAAAVVAWEDLGTEALRRLELRDFPLVVAVDCQGHDLYATARHPFRVSPPGGAG